MNIVIVILIIMQIITFVEMFSDRKKRDNNYEELEIELENELIELKHELRDRTVNLNDLKNRLNKSKRIIYALVDNINVLDVDDIDVSYLGYREFVGTSPSKYHPNTFVKIDSSVYIINSGKILNNNIYSYELTPLKGRYLW